MIVRIVNASRESSTSTEMEINEDELKFLKKIQLALDDDDTEETDPQFFVEIKNA